MQAPILGHGGMSRDSLRCLGFLAGAQGGPMVVCYRPFIETSSGCDTLGDKIASCVPTQSRFEMCRETPAAAGAPSSVRTRRRINEISVGIPWWGPPETLLTAPEAAGLRRPDTNRFESVSGVCLGFPPDTGSQEFCWWGPGGIRFPSFWGVRKFRGRPETPPGIIFRDWGL